MTCRVYPAEIGEMPRFVAMRPEDKFCPPEAWKDGDVILKDGHPSRGGETERYIASYQASEAAAQPLLWFVGMPWLNLAWLAGTRNMIIARLDRGMWRNLSYSAESRLAHEQPGENRYWTVVAQSADQAKRASRQMGIFAKSFEKCPDSIPGVAQYILSSIPLKG